MVWVPRVGTYNRGCRPVDLDCGKSARRCRGKSFIALMISEPCGDPVEALPPVEVGRVAAVELSWCRSGVRGVGVV